MDLEKEIVSLTKKFDEDKITTGKRDKNGFMVEPGEDWNDQKSDETIKYMTKPKNISSIEPRRFAKGGSSDTEVIVNNGQIQTKKDFLKKFLTYLTSLSLLRTCLKCVTKSRASARGSS